MKKIIFFAFLISCNAFSGEIYGSPPSILPECMDHQEPLPAGVSGPSARARECTRVFCASNEYTIKIKQYAMGASQIKEDAMDALTCITRKEQDFKQ